MTKEQEFLAYLKEISLINEAVGLAEWDSQTGMPEEAAGYRAEVSSYLAGMAFEKGTNEKMKAFLDYFEENPAELSEFGQEVYKKVKEEYDLNNNIPVDRFQAYSRLTSEAHSIWVDARQQKDYGVFKKTLEEIIAFNKEFIPLWRKDEKTPYDVLLNLYEPGMTTEILDEVFGQVKDGIMEIRAELAEKGTEPDTSFLHRHVSQAQQEEFVRRVVTDLGYDFKRGRLDETVHPFMLDLNRNDARITTNWIEDDFIVATLGTIHEAGHGMYEQNIDAKYDYTPLSGGVSMGIHESQSLFNEIIVGSSRSFWKKQYPVLQEITGDIFADVNFETFYNGLKKTQSSLIRIQADTLTYPLHIIIRYEIEKMIFNEGVALDNLAEIWNDKYEEYLGIRPENDLVGILQDVHWSGGSFGYFPSYALGYMYAAQLHHVMNQEFDVEAVLASDDYSPILHWLTKHIHQYGSSRKPSQLIMDATGENLNPSYLIDYMRELYFNVYDVK
ncbi:carboxypeptidase M32 [Vagococcus silagei]|uniref:Metal-dependent carboxypeptidase n=1 Tax=Vagococcus silagei TaxID=2508885 RepID=A0A4S3B0P9_9ENTE|nr:carboxypeptidase M32 [Vagococcus silagei]THB60654.1 carboxypeptidase M32 [Vagococcus silagei]